MTQFHLVLASLKVSGGTREALRLGYELDGRNACSVDVQTLWRSQHPLSDVRLRVIPLSNWCTRIAFAAAQLPILAVRFFLRVRRERAARAGIDTRWIFTHYASLPLALLVPRAQRWYFVQDLEWHFVEPLTLASPLLERFILFMYRRGTVISANAYLSQQLRLQGVPVAAEVPIWADGRYAVNSDKARDIDVVMMLRKGRAKRLDLYRLLIARLSRQSPRVRLAVITSEDEIAAMVRDDVDSCSLRPDLFEMAALYSRSRVFVLLSEHEGFGLPPLEAMGAGCVPLCRDSGGVRAYMQGPLEALLVPLHSDIEAVADRILSLLADELRRAALGELAMRIFRQGLSRTRDRVDVLSPLYRTLSANTERPGTTIDSP